MKKYKFVINGNDYEVSIVDVDENIVNVEVNGTNYKVEVDKQVMPQKTPRLLRPISVPSTEIHEREEDKKTQLQEKPQGSNIYSPLPGIILDIKVKVGDAVKIGQRLLILEAMKMENNIDSDKDGIVTEIKVHKGDSVQQGDILMVIS